MIALGRHLRSLRANRLVLSASTLIASTVGSSGLGMAFWVISAHLYTTNQMGRASAEVASITLLSGLGQIALSTTLSRFLPLARRRTRKMILLGYGIITGSTWLLGFGFVYLGFGHNFLPHDATSIVTFVITIMVFSIFTLQDVVLIAMRKSSWVLIENLLVAVARLALLPVFLTYGKEVGVIGAWTLPMLGAVVTINVVIFRQLVPEKEAMGSDTGLLPTQRQMVNFGVAEFFSGIVSTAAALIPPVLVAAKLGATASAVFYYPWLIFTSYGALIGNIGSALIVEAIHDSENTRPLLRRAATMVMGISCAAAIVLGAGAGLVLGIIGPEYRSQGSIVMELIALSLPFQGIAAIYGIMAMIDRRLWVNTALGVTGFSIFVSVGTLLSGRYGVGAFGLATLIDAVLASFVMGPGIVRRYHRFGALDKTVILQLGELGDWSLSDAQTQILYLNMEAAEHHGPKHSLSEPNTSLRLPPVSWGAPDMSPGRHARPDDADLDRTTVLARSDDSDLDRTTVLVLPIPQTSPAPDTVTSGPTEHLSL